MAVPRLVANAAAFAATVTAFASFPLAAEARTERFAPSADVGVRFRMSGPDARGTLLEFARNRVVVTRNRAGALVVRRGRLRSRPLATSTRRAVTVRVTISVRRGEARVAVAGKATRLAGRFVAERAVVVADSRAVVRAAPTGSRAPAGAPQGARTGDVAPASVPASPSTPAAMPPAVAAVSAAPGAPAPKTSATTTEPRQLFAPTSVWNAPLPDDAPLDPSSGRLVKTLTDTVAQNISANWGPWIETRNTPSFYVVPADQPTVRVALDGAPWKATLQQAFEAVPIPSNAVPGGSSDAPMVVYQPSTDRMWELFQASKQSDGWHASFGGAMSSASTSPGYYDAASWPGLSGSFWGSTATSLPVIAGTMLVSELQAGVIPHALAMNIPYALPKTYSWPAQRTDGTSTDPNAIPEGARFRLDPKLNIDALNLPPMTRMMAKAAQRYGVIVRDQTAHAISFFAENPAAKPADPYVGTAGFFGNQYPNNVMKAFPWGSLQLVKMDLRPAAPGVAAPTASAITASGATLAAAVNAHNQATSYRFEYGPTTAYGSTTAAKSLSPADDAGHAATATIAGLTPSTTYHYRVIATNATGTTTGTDATFTTSAAVAPATYRDRVVATGGLAAYWRLGDRTGTVAADETAVNRGTYAAGVTLGAAGAIAGTTDTSVGFNGTTAEMAAKAPGLGASGTIEGWFDWRTGVALMRDSTQAGGWIAAFDNAGKLSYRVAGTTYDTGLTTASVKGAWHHLAVTKNGSAVSFYLDGRLIHSGAGAGATAPAMPWHIMRNGTFAQYSQGHADDIAVYTTALSATTIAQRFSAGRGG